MDAAIQAGRAIKTLQRDKTGKDVLFAYDEAKRTLVVCAPAKVSPMSLVNVGVLTYCVTRRNRCGFKLSFLTKLSGRFKVRGALSIYLRCTAKRVSRL
jgi:hypothetical protein